MDDVTLALSQDEALVLLETLRRWNDSDALDGVLLDGEPTALHALLGALDRSLEVAYAPGHGDRVAAARRRLAAAAGD
ncbi:MAG TPA: hypothetical protein VGE77_14405 [Nocardioides sp.]